MEQVTRVPKARPDAVLRQVWIAIENLLFTLAGGQQINDQFHRDTRALDYRLPNQYLKVN